MTRAPHVAIAAVALLLCGGCGGSGAPDRTQAATPSATPAPERAEARPHTPDLSAARGRVTYCAGRAASASERRAVSRFNAAHRGDGLRVDYLQLPSDPVELRERLALLLSRGCDVAHVDYVWLAELAHAGLIADVTEYVRSREDKFKRAPLEAVRWDGRAWGVPRDADAALIYYDVPSPPATWQEVYAEAGERDGLLYAGAPGEDLTVHFLELAYAAGARVLSEDGEHSEIDSPAAVRALELMARGLEEEAVMPYVLSNTAAEARLNFADGLGTYMRNWPAAARLLRRADPRSGYVPPEFDVNELPAFEGGEAASVLGGHAVVVADAPRDRDAALALVHHLTGVKGQTDAIRDGRLAPALEEAWDSPEAWSLLEVPRELERSIDQARPRPITPAYAAVSHVITERVRLALRGEVAPETALALADKEIEETLERLRTTLEGEPS